MERGRDHGSEIDVLMMPYHVDLAGSFGTVAERLVVRLHVLRRGGLTVVAETPNRIRIAPYSHVESSTFVISQD